MQVSAEIRWFWHNTPPPTLEHWFRSPDPHGLGAGGGNLREDEYFRDPGQGELGLKRRGGKPGIEVKGLVAADWSTLAAAPFTGRVELWTKWTSEPLKVTSTILTKKTRWLRKFDTAGAHPTEIELNEEEKPKDGRALPDLGCNVELTKVELLDGDIWWTLGFESFGTVNTVAASLQAAAATLAARKPPAINDGIVASYPVWLKEHILKS